MDRTRHAAVASARRTATPRSSRARVLASARPLVRSSSRTGVQLRRKSVVGVRRRGAGEECEAQNGLQTLIVASLRLSVAPAPLAEFAVESRRADPQQLGGTFAIAADLSQGAENRTQFFAAPRLRQARNALLPRGGGFEWLDAEGRGEITVVTTNPTAVLAAVRRLPGVTTVRLVGSISRQTVSDRICGESRSGARSATTR